MECYIGEGGQRVLAQYFTAMSSSSRSHSSGGSSASEDEDEAPKSMLSRFNRNCVRPSGIYYIHRVESLTEWPVFTYAIVSTLIMYSDGTLNNLFISHMVGSAGRLYTS